MAATVSVITAAYRAADTLPRAVASVLAQSHADWEMVIAADDEEDYAGLLAAAGLADSRLRFTRTGRTGSGSSNARNVALAEASSDYVAILDADDLFHPDKLARVTSALQGAAIVTTALAVVDDAGLVLREVGTGPDRHLPAPLYKRVNLSMDSMLAYDRRVADPRYDAGLRSMTDLDFLLRLLEASEGVHHLGNPLHRYVKRAVSVSNGPGVAARMIASKTTIRDRLLAGSYRLRHAGGAAGMLAFLATSLEAEQAYEAALAREPGLLFETHLERLLSASSTSRASGMAG